MYQRRQTPLAMIGKGRNGWTYSYVDKPHAHKDPNNSAESSLMWTTHRMLALLNGNSDSIVIPTTLSCSAFTFARFLGDLQI